MNKYLLTLFTILMVTHCVITDSDDSCSVGTPITPYLTITNNTSIPFYYYHEDLLSGWPKLLDTTITFNSLPRDSNFIFKVATLWSKPTQRGSVTFSTLDYNNYFISINHSIDDSISFHITRKNKYCN